MNNKEPLSNFNDSSDTEEQIYTIVIFAKPADDDQIENIREISLEGDIEMAVDICSKLSREEWRRHRKQTKLEIRGVIYENETLTDMMFDPQWKKWFVVSTANHPWRDIFPQFLSDI